MTEEAATGSHLEQLEKPELIGLAHQMEIMVTEEISKEQLIFLLLGECSGCGKKQ